MNIQEGKAEKGPLFAGALESLGINGVALARGGRAIGFRAIPLLPQWGRFDGKLPLITLSELGPFDSEQAYGHVAFRIPVTKPAVDRFLRTEHFQTNSAFWFDFPEGEAARVEITWAFDGERAVGKIESSLDLSLILMANGCHEPARVVASGAQGSKLEQVDFSVEFAWSGSLRGQASAGNGDLLEAKLRGLPCEDAAPASVSGHLAECGPGKPVYFSVCEDGAGAVPAAIEGVLCAGRGAMERRSMSSAGAAAGCADAVQRLVGYSRTYDTRAQKRCVPVNRSWAGPNSRGAVFMWDNFFCSYMAGLFNPELARDSLGHIIGIIRDQGMEGAPVQRNLIVPIVYSKLVRFFGDRAYAAETFPVMMKFMRFWFEDRGDGHPRRDGNDDGLIESGTCLTPSQCPLSRIVSDAFDETGYDDSPQYSGGFAYERRAVAAAGVEFDFRRGTLNLTLVGQNANYVAACRAMAAVAAWVGAGADRQWLAGEADRVAGRMKERLFNPATGYYQNRFFDGTFSGVKTPTMFYPLMADLCDSATADRLRGILLDPAQFWGENVIPTVSRDDPAYGERSPCQPQGNYWRGNIWGPTNYITYLAIRQAWPDVAAEFALKSRRLFMADWTEHHHAMENYPPEGRTDGQSIMLGNGGREPHYIWGGLLAVLSLEELFSVEDVGPGLRFGSTDRRSFGAWTGFRYHGKSCSVRVDDSGVRLTVPDEFEVESTAPLAVRSWIEEPDGVRLTYSAERACRVRIRRADGDWEGHLEPARNEAIVISTRKRAG